jgi:D-3-phosphoglycerate dehydrogenase
MSKNVYIALSTFAEFGNEPIDILEENGFNISRNITKQRLLPSQIIEYASSADGVIAGVEQYTKSVLENLPNLKCISRAGVGIDNIDLKYAKYKNIEIKNTPFEVIVPVLELTMSMIFGLLRKTGEQTQVLKSGVWKKLNGSNLNEKKVGVIGTGRIGKKVAECLNYLGAEVLLCDINEDIYWSQSINLKYYDLQDIIQTCDIITLHSTSVNNGYLIKSEDIKKMKKDSIIVNTSRGDLIEENALIYGLENNILSGVGLDVFPEEPYSGKLLNYDNIILTPHIATLTTESRLKMETRAVENLVEFFTK